MAGRSRVDGWSPGDGDAQLPEALLLQLKAPAVRHPSRVSTLCERARCGGGLSLEEIAELFTARGQDVATVAQAADGLRREVCGDTVTIEV